MGKLTARSRVTRPRLTSRNEPFSLPASRRLTSIKVDTSLVSRRLPVSIVNTPHIYQTYTLRLAMIRFSFFGPSGVSATRSSRGPATSVSGVRSSWLTLENKRDLARSRAASSSIDEIGIDSDGCQPSGSWETQGFIPTCQSRSRHS